MSLNRRSWMAMTLFAGIASLFKTKAILALPIVYGDGLRDDSDGLQSYINGETVFFLNHGVMNRDGRNVIENCTFRIGKCLILRDRDWPMPFIGCRISAR